MFKVLGDGLKSQRSAGSRDPFARVSSAEASPTHNPPPGGAGSRATQPPSAGTAATGQRGLLGTTHLRGQGTGDGAGCRRLGDEGLELAVSPLRLFLLRCTSSLSPGMPPLGGSSDPRTTPCTPPPWPPCCSMSCGRDTQGHRAHSAPSGLRPKDRSPTGANTAAQAQLSSWMRLSGLLIPTLPGPTGFSLSRCDPHSSQLLVTRRHPTVRCQHTLQPGGKDRKGKRAGVGHPRCLPRVLQKGARAAGGGGWRAASLHPW